MLPPAVVQFGGEVLASGEDASTGHFHREPEAALADHATRMEWRRRAEQFQNLPLF